MKSSGLLVMALTFGACGGGSSAGQHALGGAGNPADDPNWGMLGGACSDSAMVCSGGAQPACCPPPLASGFNLVSFEVSNSALNTTDQFWGHCVDLASDPANFGACNTTALGNQVCRMGNSCGSGQCVPESDDANAFTGYWVCRPEDNQAHDSCAQTSLTGACPSGYDCWEFAWVAYCGTSCNTDADCNGGCCGTGLTGVGCGNTWTSCSGAGVCLPAGSCVCVPPGSSALPSEGQAGLLQDGVNCTSQSASSCVPVYPSPCCSGKQPGPDGTC